MKINIGTKNEGNLVSFSSMEELETVSLSGSVFPAMSDTSPPLPVMNVFTGRLTEKLGDSIKEKTYDVLMNIGEGALMFLTDTMEAIALIGGGIFIILKVVGFEKGFKYAGILFTLNVFIKYLGG